MKLLSILAGLSFLGSFAQSAEEAPKVLPLPRPNSGTYTYEQAETTKDRILSNAPSKPMKDWKNPTAGLSIHVTAADTFTVYASHPGPPLTSEADLKEGATPEEIKEILSRAGAILFGNPESILITSDRPLSESKTFPALLKVIFVPSIQLYYLSAR